MELRTPCAGTRPGAADPTTQQSSEPATAPKSFTKCPKNEFRSGAGRLKMLQNRGLEGCCAAPGGLLGPLGVGSASGEAS